MSSNFVINSVGSLLGSVLLKLSVLIHLVKRKRKGEPYDLTYYFFVLAVLLLIFWLMFVIYIGRRKRKYGRQRERARLLPKAANK